MPVAPSGYWRHAAQQRNPALRCARVQRDNVLSIDIERVSQANLQVYGADTVWRQLRREGTDVARCTVERLMRKAGLRGVMRGKVARTTVADAKAPCRLSQAIGRSFEMPRAKMQTESAYDPSVMVESFRRHVPLGRGR